MATGTKIDKFLGVLGLRRSVGPSQTIGVPGTSIYGGFIETKELNAAIGSREQRYTTYSEILANTSIVSAGIRYYLDLVSHAEWAFTPSDADTGGKFSEMTEDAFTSDPRTPFRRIVRRAAMYRLYGFSIQEWTAKRHEDGHLTFKDIEPRPQLTIDRWDFESVSDDKGKVIGEVNGPLRGVIQVSPQTSQSIYLPRGKIVYLVDDALSDSPEGLGLFRHMVAPAQRLFRYEQLEGQGFEADLRGIPIGRAPFDDLDEAVENGELSAAQRVAAEAPIRNFIINHLKSVANLALLLNSKTYESTGGDTETPSAVRKWDVELLKGSATSFAENAAAITRLNHEMARILGVEHLMLGGASAGSYALSEDKTNRFHLLVDGALAEIRESFMSDLLDTLWMLNGWPDEMKPEIVIEKVQFIDAVKVAQVLRDLATAGAVLAPDDPIVSEIRGQLGMKSTDVTEVIAPADESLLGEGDNALNDKLKDEEEAA